MKRFFKKFKKKKRIVKRGEVYHATDIRRNNTQIGKHWVVCVSSTNSDFFKAQVITSKSFRGRNKEIKDENFTGRKAFQPSRSNRKCFLSICVSTVRKSSITGSNGRYIGRNLK